MAWAGSWTTHKLAGELVGCEQTTRRKRPSEQKGGYTEARYRAWDKARNAQVCGCGMMLTERHVVLLQGAGRGRGCLWRDNGGVRLARERVRRVVHAGELDADGHIEVRLDRGHREAVENH